MKKFSKFVLVFMMILSFVFITSCDNNNPTDDIDELIAAMEELETASVTINSTMSMTITMTMNGESESQTMNADIYLESDNVKTYTITTLEGTDQYIYTVTEGDYVKEYTMQGDTWILVDTVAVADYSNNTDLFNVEVKDVFTLEDGVWVGDVEALSETLATIMEDIAADFGGIDGVSMDETSITKYNITMADGKVSLIDIEMYIKMSYQGMIMELAFAMPMNLSKLGETTVTVPENLPVE